MRHYGRARRARGGVALALAFTVAGCGHGHHDDEDHRPWLAGPRAPAPERQDHAVSAGDFPASPPPFTDGVFPCMDCHKETPPDPTVRELSQHDEIKLQHGDRSRWCFDCHNPDDRDKLRLASGQLVPFSESYRLCGQCHGDKYRDWRVGVHGRRTGEWNGRRQYLLCPHCHNPHSPRFKAIEPMAAPLRPAAIARRNAEGGAR